MAPRISLDDLVRAKLPVWLTVKNAYILTLGNIGTLLTLSTKALLIVVPLTLLYNWHIFPTIQQLYADPLHLQPGDIREMALITPFLVILTYVLLSPAAVGWHRFLLRHEEAVGSPGFDPRTVRYAGVLAALAGALQVPGVLQQLLLYPSTAGQGAGQALGALGLSLLSIAALLVFYRLSVIFPAVAVDHPDATFAGAFRASRGHTWRLLFGNLLSGLLFAIPALAFYFLAQHFDRVTGTFAITVMGLIAYVGLAIVLAFTSLAYRHFYELKKPGEV